MLPDISDDEKMKFIGRMTVLRRARRDAGRKLRDKLIPMCNAIEGDGKVWDVAGIAELCAEVNALNDAIEAIN